MSACNLEWNCILLQYQKETLRFSANKSERIDIYRVRITANIVRRLIFSAGKYATDNFAENGELPLSALIFGAKLSMSLFKIFPN